MADIETVSPATFDDADMRRHAVRLFVVGFLILFLELSCIRWFAACVVFLQFVANVVLIASFLGMSCGCLAATQRRNWLTYFPLTALSVFAVALVLAAIYQSWSGLAFGVGTQSSPQEVFFGTEYHHPDLAKFIVPIEAIGGLFFLLIALLFVGLGQTLGRAFDAYPSRVLGYTLNIGGSLAGIVVFSLISFAQIPPEIWFLIRSAGIALLLYQDRILTGPRAVALVALILAAGAPSGWLHRDTDQVRWSPYYKVDHELATNAITVNTLPHQQMIPFEFAGASYSLIHLLQQHSGGEPFKDVAIIGAGSGNDVAHALKFGAQRLDAVEIDPVIQDLGRRYHPDHPYQDPRVTPHLDDGRHFLRTAASGRYDLVVYALVDSLILHSSYANIRLESYLFTEQAFADVHRALKPDGIFVMYNYYRQSWIVERIVAMIEKTFGCKPTVLSLPYQEKLADTAADSFTMIIAGCNTRIANAFAAHKNFWLDPVPPHNLAFDGFTIDPKQPGVEQTAALQLIAPTAMPEQSATVLATDDWPFLYLHGRLIPDFTLRSIAILGFIGLGMVYLFLPKGRVVVQSRMFFLGAAFMLLETKSVAQMALLFGSTWLVNSGVLRPFWC